MVREDDKIRPGQIKFLSAAPPPMAAGEYIIRAKQVVNIPEEKNREKNATEFSKDTTTFWVGAPRFALNAGEDIYSVYPAAGSMGSYFYCLPHIVLNRKTLPWERTIDGSVAGPDQVKPPWMALLLLDEDEIRDEDITLKNVLLSEIFLPQQEAGKTIIPPGIQHGPGDAEEIETSRIDAKGAPRYSVIDLAFPLLREIVPYTEELSYLAHARQVDTGNKEAAGVNAKGWFSSVIGNRLPKENRTNTVYLVSLEGHGKWLRENSAGNPGDHIRLVVLYHWSFEAKGLNFEELVKKLNKEAGPYRIYTDKPAGRQDVADALHYGYTALNHDFRDGTKSISWYRGPLVPVNIAKPPDTMLPAADGALRYDERNGMFDVSYAAAWQLGRLLALENPGFSEAINNWKNGFARDYRLKVAKSLLEEKFKNRIDFTTEDDAPASSSKDELNFSALLQKMEGDELIKNLLLEIWHQHLK